MTKRNLKNIKSTIDSIKLIDNEKCWLLTDELNQKYCLVKESNQFLMKRNILANEKLHNDVLKSKNLNNTTFKLKDSNVEIRITDSIFKSHNWIETISFSITSFETIKFRDNRFFQFVVSSNNKKLNLYNIFDCMISVSTDTHTNALNGITFTVQDIRFNLYLVDDYFIIENLCELEFETFDGYIRNILLCFGFITGYAPMQQGYFFSYGDTAFEHGDEFAYSAAFSSTYSSSLKPINTILFYSFISDGTNEEKRKELEDSYKKDLYLISKDTFSKLCNLSIENKKLARAVELALEASQTSLESQGIVYSVVLEILSGYMYDEKPEKLKPIADKTKAKKLIENLHEVAKQNLDNYENSAIYKKIENLNSPTNRDMLLKPFEILKIELDEIDKKIINHRNDFLHCNDFIEGDELLEFAQNHFYINLKLNFLVNALILKVAGHKGKIVNYVKVYLDDMEAVKNEEFYKSIGE